MILPFLCLTATMPRRAPSMSAWLVFYDGGASMASFAMNAKDLDTVSAEWIWCDDSGHAVARHDPTASEQTQVLGIAKKNHVRVLALASNVGAGDFVPGGVEKAMASPATMLQHADELVAIATKSGIDGIDLDYESLKGADRKAFSKFVTIIADDLHRHHLKLAIALHPKTSEPGDWDGPVAQDWSVIGKACDFVRVMTYDEHWSTSDAGPVASPAWVQRVAQFAVTEIPLSKLELGIPAYGYDWVKKNGNSIGWSDFSALVQLRGAPTRDPASQELTLKYDDHTVFFADGPAQAPKFELAKTMGLRGLAMWRLGSEDPAIWMQFKKS